MENCCFRCDFKNSIKEFNNLWNSQCAKRDVQLFGNNQTTLKIDNSVIPEIYMFRQGDELLKSAFQKLRYSKVEDIGINDVIEAVCLLDSIYNTNLDYRLLYSERIYQLFTTTDLLKRIRSAKQLKEQEYNNNDIFLCVDTLTRVGKEKLEIGNKRRRKYCYSFATKFCHWIKPDSFPIYDSIACGLLFYYLSSDDKEGDDDSVWKHPQLLTSTKQGPKFKKDVLGDYRKYVEAFLLFMNKYKLTEYSIKEIDVFLWTYGKALESQNNKVENSVSYIQLEENELISRI